MEQEKETLEEAAEKVAKSKAFEFKVDYKPFETDLDYREYAEYGFKKGFLEGAKWQSERMYSEEDMKKAWSEGYHRKVDEINGNELRYFNDWIEQFKKK